MFISNTCNAKYKGVRLHGAHDIRLEEFELPEIQEDEILVKVVSDSICMSTWKMVQAGKDHKRVPENVAEVFCMIITVVSTNTTTHWLTERRLKVTVSVILPDTPLLNHIIGENTICCRSAKKFIGISRRFHLSRNCGLLCKFFPFMKLIFPFAANLDNIACKLMPDNNWMLCHILWYTLG